VGVILGSFLYMKAYGPLLALYILLPIKILGYGRKSYRRLYIKVCVIVLYLHKVITTPHNITLILILFTSLICFNLEDSYFRLINEICFNDEINGKTLGFTQININFMFNFPYIIS